MKKVANGSETTVVVPTVLEPVQIQLTLVVPVVEIRDVAITIAVRPDRAVMCHTSSYPPPFEKS